MFSRWAIDDIKAWYGQARRKPLVIRGARQVGKTTAVRLAAEQLSVPVIEINLERHAEMEPLFQRFKLDELLFNFSLISGEQVTKTSNAILFLDEAQAAPSAYSCLRYFSEDMPNLAVVLTGSLLDQVLTDRQLPTPVGRIEPYFMGPLSFEEYLAATGETKAMRTIEMLDVHTMNQVPDSVHGDLMSLVRRYTLTGGMPGCIQLARDTQHDHGEILKHQTVLIQTYKDDFAKYSGTANAAKLSVFFTGIVRQVGLQFSHKLAREISSVSSGDNRQLNAAIELFLQARLFHRVLHSNAERIPLGAETKTRISKFLFLDIGLLLAAQGLSPQAIMQIPIELANQGVLAEQFVGQQLLYEKKGYVEPELYYWQPPKSETQAEVDFLFPFENRIYPVEVKSGQGGTIKSLLSYVVKKKADQAVVISSAMPSVEQLTAKVNKAQRPFRLLRIPFYLVNQLERLL